ncbi:MAG: pantoate--beta-alanine ligase [Ghiorsea sp.]|nr:pantoate--beta-alanine ligase [Ghiorsea sp.]
MKVCTTIAEIQHELANFDKERIALVPTMGCLHEGHMSLIEKGKRLADIVVVSIYINPLQFGVNEDLDTYPRPFADDVKACQDAGVNFIFHPKNLYPEHGIQVGLQVHDLSQRLCGANRKGHFDGVVTVVNILFNIIRPHLAIFGEKDFQQLSIIQRMASDLHMQVEVVGANIIRENDGLAKSSRNRYLSNDERQQAKEIHVALRLIQNNANQDSNINNLLALGQAYLKQHNIAAEYLTICDEISLEPITNMQANTLARIFIAAKIGTTRLIDNLPLTNNNEEQPCV